MSATITGLHATKLQEPADFPVPAGREEEWRFTPLRRLRGLHADAPLGSAGATVEVAPAPEVTVEKADHAERARQSAERTFLPADRVSARAYAAATEATVITVPKET